MEGIDLQISVEVENAAWDDFLESSPQGHFQQSSAWAHFKATEGWSVVRAVYAADGSILGGFQMLWKRTRLGTLAYVSKGPVLHSRVSSLSDQATDQIRQIAEERGFAAVVVQPPDECGAELAQSTLRDGAIPCAFLGIIESTLLIDLSGGIPALASRYRGSTRTKRRKAIRTGLTVRDGDERDIPNFYRLMRMTCERQGVEPNPPTEESVRALWRSLNARRKRVFLKFAVHHDELVSGDLIIIFGHRATIFKTGWSGRYPKLRPNELLVCEGLEWAASQGCTVADFAGFDKQLAVPLLQGRKIPHALNQHRDAFKAGFGGYPKLLPSASLWFSNPFLGFCVRHVIRVRFVKNALRRMIG